LKTFSNNSFDLGDSGLGDGQITPDLARGNGVPPVVSPRPDVQ